MCTSCSANDDCKSLTGAYGNKLVYRAPCTAEGTAENTCTECVIPPGASITRSLGTIGIVYDSQADCSRGFSCTQADSFYNEAEQTCEQCPSNGGTNSRSVGGICEFDCKEGWFRGETVCRECTREGCPVLAGNVLQYREECPAGQKAEDARCVPCSDAPGRSPHQRVKSVDHTRPVGLCPTPLAPTLCSCGQPRSPQGTHPWPRHCIPAGSHGRHRAHTPGPDIVFLRAAAVATGHTPLAPTLCSCGQPRSPQGTHPHMHMPMPAGLRLAVDAGSDRACASAGPGQCDFECDAYSKDYGGKCYPCYSRRPSLSAGGAGWLKGPCSCPKDSYMQRDDDSESFICVECPAYSVTTGEGKESITSCQCNERTFEVTRDGQKQCSFCPLNSRSGGVGAESCLCDPGFYRNPVPDGERCVRCDTRPNHYCPGAEGGFTASAVSCPCLGAVEDVSQCETQVRTDRLATAATDCVPKAGYWLDLSGDRPSARECTSAPAGAVYVQSTDPAVFTTSSCPFECAGPYLADPATRQCVCPDQRVSVSVGGRDECQCPPGFFGKSMRSALDAVSLAGGCTLCTERSYCLGGEFRTDCGESRTSLPGSYMAANCTCDEHHYRAVSGQCAQCPPGQMCPGGEEASVDCPVSMVCQGGTKVPVACPPGTTTQGRGSTERAQCEPCRRGVLCTGVGATETVCPEGSMSSRGSSVWWQCVCSPGFAANGTAASRRDADNLRCAACPPGHTAGAPDAPAPFPVEGAYSSAVSVTPPEARDVPILGVSPPSASAGPMRFTCASCGPNFDGASRDCQCAAGSFSEPYKQLTPPLLHLEGTPELVSVAPLLPPLNQQLRALFFGLTADNELHVVQEVLGGEQGHAGMRMQKMAEGVGSSRPSSLQPLSPQQEGGRFWAVFLEPRLHRVMAVTRADAVSADAEGAELRPVLRATVLAGSTQGAQDDEDDRLAARFDRLVACAVMADGKRLVVLDGQTVRVVSLQMPGLPGFVRTVVGNTQATGLPYDGTGQGGSFLRPVAVWRSHLDPDTAFLAEVSTCPAPPHSLSLAPAGSEACGAEGRGRAPKCPLGLPANPSQSMCAGIRV